MITLAKTATEFGEIAIFRGRVAGSRVYWRECRPQSETDRSGVSPGTYAHAIWWMTAAAQNS
jgi:hypothetical protein